MTKKVVFTQQDCLGVDKIFEDFTSEFNSKWNRNIPEQKSYIDDYGVLRKPLGEWVVSCTPSVVEEGLVVAHILTKSGTELFTSKPCERAYKAVIDLNFDIMTPVLQLELIMNTIGGEFVADAVAE